MTLKIITLIFFAISSFAGATDFIIPDPVTYEWTVGKTRRVIPEVDINDTTIERVILFLDNPVDSPIRLTHDIPAEILNKKLNWNFKSILWMDLVAKVADIADAEIIIGKGVVTLRCKKQAAQGDAEHPATRSKSKPEGSDKPRPESEGRSR